MFDTSMLAANVVINTVVKYATGDVQTTMNLITLYLGQPYLTDHTRIPG